MAMQYFNPGLEETEPRAGFLRVLQNRLGYSPQQSIYGRYLQNQQTPYQTAFGFNQLLNPPAAGQQAESPFLSYTQGQSLGGVREQSRGLFNILGSGGGAAGIREQFQQPDEEQAGALRNLAVTALMSRISPLALRLLNVPSGGDLRDRFLAQTGGQQGGNFIEYLRNALGLGMI